MLNPQSDIPSNCLQSANPVKSEISIPKSEIFYIRPMNFQLTEDHLNAQQPAGESAQSEALPGVIEPDDQQTFPYGQVKKLGELGFLGVMVDPKYGGAGMDTISYVLALEELSKIDASNSVCMSVNNSLVCWGLETFG